VLSGCKGLRWVAPVGSLHSSTGVRWSRLSQRIAVALSGIHVCMSACVLLLVPQGQTRRRSATLSLRVRQRLTLPCCTHSMANWQWQHGRGGCGVGCGHVVCFSRMPSQHSLQDADLLCTSQDIP
jgi:hypothetical protein